MGMHVCITYPANPLSVLILWSDVRNCELLFNIWSLVSVESHFCHIEITWCCFDITSLSYMISIGRQENVALPKDCTV